MPVAGDIADAVAAAVTALALPGVTVVRRKLPSLPPGTSPPQLVVSVGEEGDTTYLDFEGSVLVAYPVAVTLVTHGGTTGDDDTFRDWREQVRRAVDDPAAFAAVPEYHRVVSSGKTPFDRAALDKELNFGFEEFTVLALESRT